MRWQTSKRASWLSVLGCFLACVGAAHQVGLFKLSPAEGAPAAWVEAVGSNPISLLLPPASAVNPESGVFVPQDPVVRSTRDDPRPPVERAAKSVNASQAPRSSSTWMNSLGMEFVHIKPGEFTMGSTATQVDQLLKLYPDSKKEEYNAEQPAHTVRITRAFELGRHKVTVGQYRLFLESTHYQAEADRNGRGGTRPEPWFPQSDDHPVVNVSWNDAHAFCDWLTTKENGRVRYRLPTEAEWEYACRAGSTTLFLNGDDPEKLALIANVADASARRKYADWTWTIRADDGFVYTSPVGSYAPNAWGLFDMIGNVWEWCEDRYELDYYKNSPSDDPPGPSLASARVIRGSPWFINPRRCRPTDRGGFAPDFRCSFLGFRLAAARAE